MRFKQLLVLSLTQLGKILGGGMLFAGIGALVLGLGLGSEVMPGRYLLWFVALFGGLFAIDWTAGFAFQNGISRRTMWRVAMVVMLILATIGSFGSWLVLALLHLTGQPVVAGGWLTLSVMWLQLVVCQLVGLAIGAWNLNRRFGWAMLGPAFLLLSLCGALPQIVNQAPSAPMLHALWWTWRQQWPLALGLLVASVAGTLATRLIYRRLEAPLLPEVGQ
ncbi:hypothetical protein [Lacticaseibacillus suibinensis]|uniref:hypothetical protein n=1 Tax=Lacticaseibacillus suibinensis TaxID=2486011 RepID=UPI000F783137|nr:hypothetical protein [Lacticaseibacillus suibinensis]